jgi:hypothetical protein
MFQRYLGLILMGGVLAHAPIQASPHGKEIINRTRTDVLCSFLTYSLANDWFVTEGHFRVRALTRKTFSYYPRAIVGAVCQSAEGPLLEWNGDDEDDSVPACWASRAFAIRHPLRADHCAAEGGQMKRFYRLIESDGWQLFE